MPARSVSFVENGVWVTREVSAAEPVKDVREVPMAPHSFEDCAAMVASVVAAASRLSFKDQQRVRDVMLAAGSLMSAKTRIDDQDDRLRFEAEINKALARR